MASNSETGHNKIVANFESLNTAILTFGSDYNPSKSIITIEAIQNLLTSAKGSINELNDANAALTSAIDACEIAFEPLSRHITRIHNALKASASADHVDESVKTIIRKLQGRRAGAKITDEEKKALEADGKEVTQISVSQMSYDALLDNFDKLISLLTTIPEYNPNEVDLKIESLKTFKNNLSAKNAAVTNATVHAINLRGARNKILYSPIIGVVPVASDIKAYIKSVWGVKSIQYKQISKLSFSTPKGI